MWVAVCAAILGACGDDGDGGGGGDGGPDDGGAPADAEVGTVTVSVRDDNDEPAEGALAIFADADGNLVDEVTTDAAGVATARMAAGGSVTVIRTFSDSFSVASTYLDLWPDASIVSQFKNGMKPREEVAIAYPGVGNPIDYRVVVGCYPDFGGNGVRMTTELDVSMTVDSRCGDDFDVLVIARRNGLPTQSLLGTSVSRPSVSLAGMTYTDNAPLTATFTDIPDVGGNDIAAALRAWFRQGVLNTTPIASGNLAAGSITFDAPTLANHAVDLFMVRPDAGAQYYFERLAPGAIGLTRSLAGRIQPWVIVPAVDLDARTVGWTEVAPVGVVPPQAVFVQLRYNGGRAAIWNVIAPASRIEDGPGAGMRTLQLPDVPGDRQFEPKPGDQLMSMQVETVRADDAAVDAVRGVIEPALSYDLDFFRAPEITFFSLAGAAM